MKKKKALERMLLDYKNSGDEIEFEEILKHPQIKLYMRGVTSRYNKINYGLNQIEDVTQIASTEIWKAIHKYRFLCPVCGIEALSEVGYKSHMDKKHGGYRAPQTSCIEFIKYNTGAYIQNEIKKEYSKKRCEANTIHGVVSKINSTFDSEDADSNVLDVLNELVNSLENDFTEDSNFMNVVKEAMNDLDMVSQRIINGLINSDTVTDIATDFYKEGIYGTLQSARVSVNRKINTVIKGRFGFLIE